jgi:hypothetical protein
MSATSKITNQGYVAGSKPEKKRQAWLAHSYEWWFLELPVPIVLTVMWLAGVGVISAGVLVLYLFWSTVEGMLGG